MGNSLLAVRGINHKYIVVVKEEMQFAIREAMKSAEPEAIAFWKAVAPDGKEPPIEKVIAMIALKVNNRMYN